MEVKRGVHCRAYVLRKYWRYSSYRSSLIDKLFIVSIFSVNKTIHKKANFGTDNEKRNPEVRR